MGVIETLGLKGKTAAQADASHESSQGIADVLLGVRRLL